MKKIFITSFCILSTVGLTSFFMPYILTTQINKNKDYIESYIKEKTHQTIHFDQVETSFHSIKVKNIEIGESKSVIKFENIDLNINLFNIFNDNKISLIKDIKIQNIFIPKKESNHLVTLDDLRDQALNYLPYLEFIKTIKISHIKTQYSDLNEINLIKNKDNFEIKLSSVYLNNIFNFNGYFNYTKFLKSKQLDSDLNISSSKIQLNKFNQFFNQKELSFNDGFISSTQSIKIRNNDISIDGHSQFKQLTLTLLNKKFQFVDNSFNNHFKSHHFELDFDKIINMNNIDFNIKKIIANSDANYKNIKNIIIKSDKLEYEAQFSQNFYQTTKDKKFSLKFNTFDLNYLTKLGIVKEIPSPYNNALISNGLINVNFNKEIGSQYEITYDVKADAKLNVPYGFLKGKAKIENNKLFIDNLSFNDEKQSGYFQYEFSNNNFILNLNQGLRTRMTYSVKVGNLHKI